MAFHVACPITCRRICDCELGFPEGLQGGKAREDWWDQIEALQDFLLDPWSVRPAAEAGPTVQVPVPKVEPPPAPPPQAAVAVAAVEDGEDAQHKHAALQRQAIAASAAAEDYVRKLEAGGAAAAAAATDFLGEEDGDFAKEDHGSKVMCRMCFSGENEGSYRAEKMLSCKICNKKYHRSCLKSWAAHRDLFHWSSWACPSCRICEVCRRAGDPTKFMYCKRCDGAYHCYCQQPPHKNASQGPYLCPKHTRCHSCGSTVPGSGLSTRWFLGYTCCDACGRLFTKGNYCPVCLKVYRDSETTPMVCCDDCERWVHCSCDGISDEKYQQFQSDQNLQYRCPACRGDCYQFANMEDAVRELWNRRDEADRDLISGLRAAAGLPSKEEIFCISPYSDDEQSGPVILKNENGRSWKFSLKGLGDKSAKNSKEHGKSVSKTSNKKSAKKKGYRIKFVGKVDESYQNYERQDEEKSLESNFKDTKFDDINLYKTDVTESVLSSLTKSSGNGRVKSRVEQLGSGTFNRGSRMECVDGKLQGPDFKEYAATNTSKNDNVKGTKIVIHLGGRNRTVSSSPRSENSSFHKDQDLAASHGSEDTSQLKPKDSNSHAFEAHAGVARHDGAQHDEGNQGRSSKHGDTKKNVIKLGKISDIQRKTNGNTPEDSKPMASLRSPVLGNRSMEVDSAVETEAKPMTHDAILKKGAAATLRNDSHDNSRRQTVSGASNDPKPLLRLKFKNPYMEQRSSWAPRGEEENSVKGQRSKRKRCSTEKLSSVHEDDSHSQQQVENSIDKVMDANWILQKLGKDAIGKRVEVHQSSDNSWHKGMVSNLIGGSSSLSVQLDDGRLTTLELGKQGVRFVSQKQKKAKR